MMRYHQPQPHISYHADYAPLLSYPAQPPSSPAPPPPNVSEYAAPAPALAAAQSGYARQSQRDQRTAQALEHVKRGDEWLNQGRKWKNAKEARREYRSALGIDGSCHEAFDGLSIAQASLAVDLPWYYRLLRPLYKVKHDKYLNAALQSSETAIHLQDCAVYQANRGDILMRATLLYTRAAQCYSRAMELDPQNASRYERKLELALEKEALLDDLLHGPRPPMPPMAQPPWWMYLATNNNN